MHRLTAEKSEDFSAKVSRSAPPSGREGRPERGRTRPPSGGGSAGPPRRWRRIRPRCGSPGRSGGLQGIERVLRHQGLVRRQCPGPQVIDIRPVLADAQLAGGVNGLKAGQKAQPLQGPGHMGTGAGGGGGDGYAPVPAERPEPSGLRPFPEPRYSNNPAAWRKGPPERRRSPAGDSGSGDSPAPCSMLMANSALPGPAPA